MVSRLNADPARYGIDLPTAAAYEALHDAYAAAYQTASDDITRTKITITAKDLAKEALIDGPDGIREIVDFVQGRPETTDVMRAELQINIRAEPTPAPVPSVWPQMSILSVVGRTVTIRLEDSENPLNRGRPEDVASATVLMFVGEDAPTELTDWSFYTNATKVRSIPITFGSAIPAGSKVWVTAFWMNTRGESGPPAPALSTNIAENPVQSQAA